MRRKTAVFAVLAVLVLAVLAGCNVYNLQLNVILGSIYVEAAAPVAGGTPYHVLLYQPPDSIDLTVESTVNDMTPVLNGTFQETGDGHITTNYTIYNVPAGEYLLFVWVDWDTNGTYNNSADLVGFYDQPLEPVPPWQRIAVEPGAPNVVMTENGIVDIDLWVGTYVPVT